MLLDCFPEPNTTDDSLARHGEYIPSWLQKSVHPRAHEVRAFINRNVACLPEEARSRFCHALKVRWSSALFELVVARALQLLGATIEVEPDGRDGHHPDFRASFDGKVIIVEATAPEFDQDIKQKERAHRELIPIIEKYIPEGWSILLGSLPLIGPSESKAELKRALCETFSNALTANDNGRQISIELKQGLLAFTLIQGSYGSSPIVGGPWYTTWSDSKQRLLHVLKKKRRQVCAQDAPVLLAVNAEGISSDFDDFDSVLFGCYETRLDPISLSTESFFNPTGVFASKSHKSTYTGVWAFLRLSPFKCEGPVLYIRPGAESEIPVQFEACETRFLKADGIYVKAGSNPRFLDQIGWAKL